MKTDLVVAGYIFGDKGLLLVLHRKLNLWLPVGGHIDENETPDDALIREAKEETGLDIELLNQSNIPLLGNVKRNLATPFYSNVHAVGDHYHSCLFYICQALNPDALKISSELIDARWFQRYELGQDLIPFNIRVEGEYAFDLYKELAK